MYIQIGKTFYKISKPLYKKYASQLTKASEEAVKGAKNIVKIGSNKLIKLLGGQQPTKASLSQKGVKKVVGKGAAGTFGAGVVVGALLPKGKGTSYTPPGGTLAPLPKKKKAKFKPGRKPTPPPPPPAKPATLKPGTGEKKAPTLPKAKEIKPHSTPPKGMKNPMIMKSGSKTYANSSRPTNYKD